MSPLTLLGEFGWRELVFVAAIILVLAGARRLAAPRHTAPPAGSDGARDAASHAYLDRLIGPAEPGKGRIGTMAGGIQC
jgi:hypothetical protein